MSPFELPMTDPVVQFAALVAIALIVQLTVERLHLPGLTGLIVAGMLIGPGGFGLFDEDSIIEFLGSVGLVYLMFMAGLEVDLKIVRAHKRETITFGLLAFILSLIPAVIVAHFLGYSLRAALLLGVLISSHTLVAYPIIAQLGLLHRRPIVAAIGGTLITDTLALIALAILLQAQGLGEFGSAAADAAAQNGSAQASLGEESDDQNNGGLFWLVPLLLLGILTALSLWLLPYLSRAVFDRFGATKAEKALYILAVLLVLASVAELIGTKDILGAFLAGICLNPILGRREDLREHVEFVGRMLFIPLFFIFTGTLLELEIFTSLEVWIMAGILLALVLFGKATASWISGWAFGYSCRDRIIMIGLTIPQAAATLAVTMAAREAELFPETVVDAVIIVIFITCLAGPVLARQAAIPLARFEARKREEETPRRG